MTAHDVLKIAVTVSVTQCICDLLARRFVYNAEPYQKALTFYQRAKTKRDKAIETAAATKAKTTTTTSTNAKKNSSNNNDNTNNTSSSKSNKKLQRLEDDMNSISAEVAKRHVMPSFLTSFVFLILYRILSAEYSGKVIAVLPFEPHWILKKITCRGLKFVDLLQDSEGTPLVTTTSTACSFAFVYLLCTMSCKFMANKTFGFVSPVDSALSNVLDSPKSQKLLKSMGVDTEELNEAKKIVGW